MKKIVLSVQLFQLDVGFMCSSRKKNIPLLRRKSEILGGGGSYRKFGGGGSNKIVYNGNINVSLKTNCGSLYEYGYGLIISGTTHFQFSHKIAFQKLPM